ncbi:phasin family protein [Methyloceanibacter superfactus]|nr:phasin family protein [Methyloceanibacter superfactus]
MDETVIRETAKAPAPAPAPEPPVLVNAVKPEERLSEPVEDAIESAVQTLEKSFEAAMPAALAVNQKLVDIAQANMNAGLDLARDLAAAKSPMEAMRLGMNYWHDNAGLFQSQAEELWTLSAQFLTTANEPLRAHIRRS